MLDIRIFVTIYKRACHLAKLGWNNVVLQEAGWCKFFCGPESFIPDDKFYIGEAPGLKNYYIA